MHANTVLQLSTYSADSTLVDTVKLYEPQLSKTRCFLNPSKNLFQFVKKVGPNLKNRLVKTKYLALGEKFGATVPCTSKNCKCCKLIDNKTSLTINNRVVKVTPGNCIYNIIYLLKCRICQFGHSTCV